MTSRRDSRPLRREATVAVSIVSDVLGYLERKGLRRADVCAEAGLEDGILADPRQRVPGSRMEALWEAGVRLTGDMDLGLHTGESFNAGALDIVGYVVLSSATVGDALQRLARYASLLNDGLEIRVERDGARTVCSFHAIEGLDNYVLRSPRQPLEAMAAGTTVHLGRISGGPFRPLEVSFRHPAPVSLVEHRRIFGRDPLYEASTNSIVFATADVNLALPSANPALLEVFERHADALVASSPATGGVVAKEVVARIVRRLRGSAPTVHEVASDLAMSGRSLQRALGEEGRSYQELLDGVRREAALQQLEQPGRSTADVAFLLGFAELSTFHRAFKRWTGTTPGAYRPARRRLPRTRSSHGSA